jgi:glucokinase
MSPWPALVVDLGGTHVRLGIVDGPGMEPRAVAGRLAADAGTLDRAIEEYLAKEAVTVASASLAIAGPVVGDVVVPSNLGWHISRSALQAKFGFKHLVVRNDFYVLALSLSRLAATDLAAIGGGTAETDSPRVVIEPGTGLGVAAVIRSGGRWIAVPSEAGQANFAPGNARERAIAEFLERKGRVTVETVLSGPGLLALAEAVAALDGTQSSYRRPEDVAAAATRDPLAAAALEVFFGALGAAAGDAALAFCATGGVFLAGGILPQLVNPLRASAFRARFEDKAPLQDLVRRVPTWVIMRPHPGLLGAAAALEEDTQA